MIRTNAVVLAILMMSVDANASECQKLIVPEGRVITIDAAVNHATRIQLPEPIASDMPGNAGQGGLWEVAASGTQYWVKPKDAETDDGASSSLTLLTARRAYDFLLRRVPAVTSPCYVIDEPQTLGGGSVLGLRSTLNAPSAAPAGHGAAERLFTRYQWRSSDIEAVYDDGRYTYVRLAPRPEGKELPVLHAGTAKKPEIIEATYDAGTRTFRIPGIYDELMLRDARSTDRLRRVS